MTVAYLETSLCKLSKKNAIAILVSGTLMQLGI